MNPADLEPACAALVAEAGYPGPFTLEGVAEGANNRVFRVQLASEALLLKAYFRHPNDPRDRLGTEFAFSRFAWENGVRALPRPLASNPGRQLGLFEFVAGRRPSAEEIDDDAVGQAIEFFRALDRCKGRPGAAALPNGSESCFSLAEHLECVEGRVRRLGRIEPAEAVDRDAERFVLERLRPSWEALASSVRLEVSRLGDDPADPLDPGDRCLSPSDFGYHNALRDDDGRYRFLDFEYAGWDDPAKLVCDFFCQPAIPVPPSYFGEFAESVVATSSDPGRQLRRIGLLLPVYRIKWCCILLNDFLPVGRERRQFAARAADQGARKAEQLRKALQALANLNRVP